MEFENLTFLKAIIIGLHYYAVATFIDTVSLSFFSNFVVISSYVWWLVSGISIFFWTRYYYFKRKPKNPLWDGLLFGVMLGVFTFIVEIILVVYGFGMGWEIYQFWEIYLQYPVVIISPIIAALTK